MSCPTAFSQRTNESLILVGHSAGAVGLFVCSCVDFEGMSFDLLSCDQPAQFRRRAEWLLPCRILPVLLQTKIVHTFGTALRLHHGQYENFDRRRM